jgi:O-antigen/teichoic acid export membrane protein
MLYTLLSIAGTLLCFIALSALQLTSLEKAFGFALFFLFTSMNFPWYALRYISIAVDDYVFFETVEAVRRFASIGLMLLMLAGLAVPVFLILVNLLWVVSLTLVIFRLRRKKILDGRLRGALTVLWPFYRDNRRDLIRTGTPATADYYTEHLPYLVVPLAFGLGAPTVILDAIFKFVHGAAHYYSAICDIAVPQQTSAIASRDIRTLIYSTLLAFGLAIVPTAIVAGGLIFAGDLFFKLLLGPAATMPPEAIWIIIALLFGKLVQVLSHSLLIHTGHFKEGARVMGFTAVMVTILPALAFVNSPTIIGFLALYAAAFGCGAILHIALAIKGPIQSARRP